MTTTVPLVSDLPTDDGSPTAVGMLADMLLNLATAVPELEERERQIRLASLLPRHRSVIVEGGWSKAEEVLAEIVGWLGSYEHARLVADVKTPDISRFVHAMSAMWAHHAEVCRNEAATLALSAALTELTGLI